MNDLLEAPEPDRPLVAVLGLGYVGLTLATVLAGTGCRVIGIERRPELVAATNRGAPHFSEAGLAEALGRAVAAGALTAVDRFPAGTPCHHFIITVGTPLGPDGRARLDMIEAATREVAEAMADDSLVVLRSTVKIGTARGLVAPILVETGRRFDLAMCPERTLEGRALQELRELPQIVGADSPESRSRAAALFRRLTNSIVEVSSLEAAEIVKLVDNTYRDVQFGFANEVARLCEAYAVNALEVIASGKLGYGRTNVPLPGPVGGPCLEKDPHILAESAGARGIDLEITRAARLVNERQPAETVRFVAEERARRGIPAGARAAILGMAFKGVPATDDLRGSMSLKVLAALRAACPDLDIVCHDPVIDPETLGRHVDGAAVAATLADAVAGASLVLIANNHPSLGALPPRAMLQVMAPGGFIYDYWNHFSNLSSSELAGAYFAVGHLGGGR